MSTIRQSRNCSTLMFLTTLITSLLARIGVKSGVRYAEVVKLREVFHQHALTNAYTQMIQPGTSWPLNIFGLVGDLPSDADRSLLVMVDSVSRYLIISTHKNKDEKTIVPSNLNIVIDNQGQYMLWSLIKVESSIILLKNYYDNGIRSTITLRLTASLKSKQ